MQLFARILVFSCALLCQANVFCSEKSVAMSEALDYGARTRNSWPAKIKFDANKASAKSNLRRIEGKHLVLFTDMPSSPRIDELPEIFDAAVPLWCEFFRVDPSLTSQWKMIGVLVKNDQKFAKTELLASAPKLRHGYSVGHLLWLREQKSDYYRRHLLLHEGVHGFMNHFFGTCGPDWFMEGLAEYLGTHRWDHRTGTLEIGYYPKDVAEVMHWERIRLVREKLDLRQGRSLNSVLTRMKFSEDDDTYTYAWSWAAAAFLNRHPLYKDVLRESVSGVRHRTLTRDVLAKLEKLRPDGGYEYDWLDFLANLQYDYDFQRTPIAPTSRVESNGKTRLRAPFEECGVEADRGWCNSGIFLEQGKTYRFQAQGRVQLAQESQARNGGEIWWSEPNGVTIRYHHGKPLGVLLGTVIPERFPKEKDEFFDAKNPLFEPVSIGMGTSWKCTASGTLYFRVNDSASELADNQGHYTVRVSVE